jgi:hypothetical protein
MCVCVFHCIFSILIKNLFAVNNCTSLKYIGIRVVIGFMGMPLWLRVCREYVINLVTVGDP